MGCGPATLTAYLAPRVAPGGTVIGADLAEKMVERARKTATARGWTGVEFVETDALEYSPPSPVDAVVFSLSLSTMEDPQATLTRAVSWLKPGGQLVILDSIPDPRRPWAQLVIFLKSPRVGAGPTCIPIDFAEIHLEEVEIQTFLMGVYTLVSARKPNA